MPLAILPPYHPFSEGFSFLFFFGRGQHYPVRRYRRIPHSNLGSDNWRDLHDRALRSFLTRHGPPAYSCVLQMLNTASNLGGTWPGFFVLRGIDYFTIATCKVKEQGSEVLIKGEVPGPRFGEG